VVQVNVTYLTIAKLHNCCQSTRSDIGRDKELHDRNLYSQALTQGFEDVPKVMMKPHCTKLEARSRVVQIVDILTTHKRGYVGEFHLRIAQLWQYRSIGWQYNFARRVEVTFLALAAVSFSKYAVSCSMLR
jgi:hypothetical protein